MKHLTTDEKIDFIYKILEKQEKRYKRSIIIKTIIRLAILAYLIYFIMFWYQKLINDLKEKISFNIPTEINYQELMDNFKNNFKN